MSPESAPEGAEAPDTGEAPATPEAPPAPTGQPDGLGRIYERMDEFQSQQQQLVDQMTQLFTPPEEEPVYYDDDTGELTEDGVRGVVNDFVNEAVETRLSERERREAIEDRDLDWQDAMDEVPELKDPQYSREIIDWAADLVGRDERIIGSPKFVEVIKAVHAQRKLAEHAAAQTPAEGRGVVLESAQGAAQPTKGSDDVDWSDRIVKAAERLRPQI